MKNIFMTNVAFNSVVDEEDPDLMVFTNLSAEVIAAAYRNEGRLTFDECYEVPDQDVQYHLYAPAWLNEKEERKLIELAEGMVTPC